MIVQDMVLIAVICVAVGISIGYARWGNPPPPPPLERLAEGDIREVIAKLRPLTRHNWPTDVSISVYGDGDIRLRAKLLGGMEVYGCGGTLEAAAHAICRQCNDVREALNTGGRDG
jgi:hypothetical protein